MQNIDLMSEACQNAVHQQLPPPPFYSFHNLSGPAVGKRNIGSGMLIEPIGSYLHNNSYIWTYAALIKIVLPSLRKISTRWKISTPQKVSIHWIISTRWIPFRARVAAHRTIQNALNRSVRDGEVCHENFDPESLVHTMETPKVIQVRTIVEWPKVQDEDGARPRLRTRRQNAESQSDSGPVSWQDRLEGREITILAPVAFLMATSKVLRAPDPPSSLPGHI